MRWALNGDTTDSIDAFMVRIHSRGSPASSRPKKRGTTSVSSAR
jgi:hypothetical protein